MKYFLGLVILVLSACTSLKGLVLPSRSDDPLFMYKADIQFVINGVAFDGFSKVDLQNTVVISMKSKAKLDLLQISSCHRSFSVERADQDWFGGVGHSYTYRYSPVDVERQGFCPLYVQAFDTSGSTSWGMIAFRTDETLDMEMACSGSQRPVYGLAICQSQINQVQTVKFAESVSLKSSPECKVEAKDNNLYEISSRGGFCLITAKAGDKIGRVLLLGYRQLHVR